MSRIFISYRREDAPAHAGRLYDRLAGHFGHHEVFRDIDTIEPGEDFVTAIEGAMESVVALIAVIGRSWLDEPDPVTGRRKLENPNDFVRLEIKTALERKIRVIPVLVQQAGMPPESELPADVAGLARRNALQLSDVHWNAGVERLIETVAKIVDERRVTQADARPATSGRVTEPPIESKSPLVAERKPVEPDRGEKVRSSGPKRAAMLTSEGLTIREVRTLTVDYPVMRVALSPDGSVVAAAGQKEMITLWSIETGKAIARLKHNGTIATIAFSPDGARLATGADETVKLWDAASGAELARMNHGDAVGAVAFSPDGHYLATGSLDRTARIWDAKSGGAVVLLQHDGWVSAIHFSPESARVATASNEGISRVWDAKGGRELARVNHGFWSSDVSAVLFTPDGRKVISAAAKKVVVWDAGSGTVGVELKHEGLMTTGVRLALTPDGELLATHTSFGSDVHLWKIADRRELARLTHEGSVSAMCFDPLGRYLATASLEGPARIWDLQGRPLASLTHEGTMTGLAISADGRRIASASKNKTVCVWELR